MKDERETGRWDADDVFRRLKFVQPSNHLAAILATRSLNLSP
jgi:hypothetical protein